MTRRPGWSRVGSRRRFRYLDATGTEITDEEKLERIRALVIPPAWRDVWIAPGARSKLQATGVDAAGRTQYLYHPVYRARQEEAKYAKLIRFAEALPALREATAADIARDGMPYERAAAIAVRLINLGWFRVGSDRYVKTGRTFGITTLRKRHVTVRGSRISFCYIRQNLGAEFTAKDFRTWGGTLHAAIELAEGDPPASPAQSTRRVAEVMRHVAEQLGNTPAVARVSSVSPAVVEQYLDGRTISDFRPRRLRVVEAGSRGLDPEEQATLSLLRSWRIRGARAAA